MCHVAHLSGTSISTHTPVLQSCTQKPFLQRKSLFLLAFLFFPLFSIAQEKKVEDTYLDYFSLPRESLFLHTNKTTFIVGEEIWFKIYAYDRKNEKSSNGSVQHVLISKCKDVFENTKRLGVVL